MVAKWSITNITFGGLAILTLEIILCICLDSMRRFYHANAYLLATLQIIFLRINLYKGYTLKGNVIGSNQHIYI